MKYNLSNNKSLSIAVRCDSYQEALQIVTMYKMKFTDPFDDKEPAILFDWTESQPFLCLSPKYLPPQFVTHYYAKENKLEVVQFADFLRDNSLVAEAGKVNGSSGDGTGQQKDYMPEFRIWDRVDKRWMPQLEDVTEGNATTTTATTICLNGRIQRIGVIDTLIGPLWEDKISFGDRFAMSFSLNINDTAGRKAFSGDIIYCETILLKENKGEFVWHDNGWWVKSMDGSYRFPFKFTIIGNRWEGIFETVK